jgi:hypothetical protein
MEINIGDKVQMRKKHPCGSDQWLIYRTGADIGMRCLGCDRRVMLSRAEFNKRLRCVVVKALKIESTTFDE